MFWCFQSFKLQNRGLGLGHIRKTFKVRAGYIWRLSLVHSLRLLVCFLVLVAWHSFIPEILSVQFPHQNGGAYGSMGYFTVVACQIRAGEDTTRDLQVLVIQGRKTSLFLYLWPRLGSPEVDGAEWDSRRPVEFYGTVGGIGEWGLPEQCHHFLVFSSLSHHIFILGGNRRYCTLHRAD